MPLTIGFTGTRLGMNAQQHASLYKVLKHFKPTIFRHGDCKGADVQAHRYARMLGLDIVLHPCTLNAQRAFSQGALRVHVAKMPLARNKDIVRLSDILIAAPSGSSEIMRSGTWATIRVARREGKPTVIIWPDGKFEAVLGKTL